MGMVRGEIRLDLAGYVFDDKENKWNKVVPALDASNVKLDGDTVGEVLKRIAKRLDVLEGKVLGKDMSKNGHGLTLLKRKDLLTLREE